MSSVEQPDARVVEAEEWLCRASGDEGMASLGSREQKHDGVPGPGSHAPKCDHNVRQAVSYLPEPAHLAAIQGAAACNPVELPGPPPLPGLKPYLSCS